MHAYTHVYTYVYTYAYAHVYTHRNLGSETDRAVSALVRLSNNDIALDGPPHIAMRRKVELPIYAACMVARSHTQHRTARHGTARHGMTNPSIGKMKNQNTGLPTIFPC